MRQRTTLVVAATITAFILVLGGSLVARLTQATTVAQDAAAQNTSVPDITADPTVQALLKDREDARLSLEQANERLREAARQLSNLQQTNDKLSQSVPQQPVGVNPVKGTVGTISRDKAIATATAYLGGGSVKEVEISREHGTTAYEVKFTNGSTVYVDASTGEVAYAKIGGGTRQDDD
ncbi:MAG: PepSY domain-containing protein [Dehalococcoidia bacterium]|nr:PepSY domain-containing protein [Dehalococcoidia bacterium]